MGATSDETSTLAIKNMVCPRCIRVVREELERLGYSVCTIVLGEAVITPVPDAEQKEQIRRILEENGFELMDSRIRRIVESIKTAVISRIYGDERALMSGENWSEYISQIVHFDYGYLSTLFSSKENVTIERYVILQKIERVKELMKYDELTLSQIADQLGYSSVAHLSNQFKQVTGLSPSAFKKLRRDDRKGIDAAGEKETKFPT